MMSSTRSSESALRSSMKDASGVMSSSLTLSCSAMIFRSRSSGVVLTRAPPKMRWARQARPAATPARSRQRPLLTRLRLVRRSRPVRAGRLLFAPDQVAEHPVDEAWRTVAPVALRQLDGLVDRHARRHLLASIQAFVDPHPQDV